MKPYVSALRKLALQRTFIKNASIGYKNFPIIYPLHQSGLLIHWTCIKDGPFTLEGFGTFGLHKAVLIMITVNKENQSVASIVPRSDSCFLIGGLNISVLLQFCLVSRDCHTAFRINVHIIRFLSFSSKSH